MPTCLPAEPKFIPILAISLSVVAKLFPKATITDPNLSKSDWLIFVTLANLARVVAASSADKLVAFPISIIVLVNFKTLSVCIPNCPAASPTEAISSADEGICFDKSSIPCLKLFNCSSVPSTVFVTPVHALSKEIDAFRDAPAIVAIPALNTESLFPALSIFLPKLFKLSPNFVMFFPAVINFSD